MRTVFSLKQMRCILFYVYEIPWITGVNADQNLSLHTVVGPTECSKTEKSVVENPPNAAHRTQQLISLINQGQTVVWELQCFTINRSKNMLVHHNIHWSKTVNYSIIPLTMPLEYIDRFLSVSNINTENTFISSGVWSMEGILGTVSAIVL